MAAENKHTNLTDRLTGSAEAAGVIVSKLNFMLNEIYARLSKTQIDTLWLKYDLPFARNMGHIVMDYMDELKPLIRELIDIAYAVHRGGKDNKQDGI